MLQSPAAFWFLTAVVGQGIECKRTRETEMPFATSLSN